MRSKHRLPKTREGEEKEARDAGVKYCQKHVKAKRKRQGALELNI